eukprot:347807-Lingulodinium_polyedra.AAC.1
MVPENFVVAHAEPTILLVGAHIAGIRFDVLVARAPPRPVQLSVSSRGGPTYRTLWAPGRPLSGLWLCLLALMAASVPAPRSALAAMTLSSSMHLALTLCSFVF